SKLVIRRPAFLAGTLLIILLVGVFNFSSMKYSFNLLKSFPEDMPSRQGFELLEKNYPAGELAPVNIVLQSSKEFELSDDFIANVNNLVENLEGQKGVSSVTPVITDQSKLPRNFLSKSEKAIRIQLILKDNPYDVEALDTIQRLRDSADTLLKENGFFTKDVKMHFAGQTAQQVDVRQMNERDMIVLFSLVTVLLTFIL